MRRRALLSTALGSTIVGSGCLGVDGGQEGEGTTVEIIPRNHTDREISLQVAVYAMDGSLLLDHTYTLPGGQGDESKGVENRVSHLVVSLDNENDIRHEYAPDGGNCSREGEDVQILVESDGISFAYSC